jgi:DNA-binding MarR family transcriptional regulator
MLQVLLTIYPSLRAMDRRTLITELIAEMAGQSPVSWMRSMRRWPTGKLSLVHLNVLMLLEIDGPLPMRGLAEAMDVSQASATGIVDRMEHRRLVERRRDDEDRRVIHVALTEEGRRLIEGMAAQRRDHLVQILETLTDDELAGFLAGSRALRRARDHFHSTGETTR